MELLTSKRSWLVAPVVAVAWALLLLVLWAVMDPQTLMVNFDNAGRSPVELMTLPLFALIVPLVWLCPPQSGSTARQVRWSSLWSLLGMMAIVRETDIHKLLFAKLWPDIVFKGTAFKMRFLKASGFPVTSKLFVLCFFIVFFAVVIIPLIRYLVPLIKGFFKFEPVAWTMACFGGVSIVVLTVDRLPAGLRHAHVVVSKSILALMKVLEEGGEMLMALLALLAILQAYLFFGRKGAE